LEQVLAKSPQLKARINLIDALWELASAQCRPDVIRWCNEQTNLAFATLKKPDVEDVPLLLSPIQEKGISFLSDV